MKPEDDLQRLSDAARTRYAASDEGKSRTRMQPIATVARANLKTLTIVGREITVLDVPEADIVRADRKRRYAEAKLLCEAWPGRPDLSDFTVHAKQLIAEVTRAAATECLPAGLIFMGPTGLGKSAAAWQIVDAYTRRGIRDGGAAWDYAERIRWFHAPELFEQKAEGRYDSREPEAIRIARMATLLVINDLGKEVVANGIDKLLEYRYERGHKTIVTSQKPLAWISERYDESMVRKVLYAGGKEGTYVDLWSNQSAEERNRG